MHALFFRLSKSSKRLLPNEHVFAIREPFAPLANWSLDPSEHGCSSASLKSH